MLNFGGVSANIWRNFWGSKCWNIWECTWEVGGWTIGWKLLKHRSLVESLPHFFIWVKNSGPSGWSRVRKIRTTQTWNDQFLEVWTCTSHIWAAMKKSSRQGPNFALVWRESFFRNHPKTSHFVWSPGLSGKPVLLAISCAKKLCVTAPEGISVTEVTFQSTIHTFKAYNLQFFLYMKT